VIQLDILVEGQGWTEIEGLETLCKRAMESAACQRQGNAALLLTSDARMQSLNRDFRARDKPTDVLSFPADPMDAPFLGDIAIGFGVASGDALKMNKRLTDHLAHLVIHGYLHLIGFDHESDAQAQEMQALERAALASMGIADPYLCDL